MKLDSNRVNIQEKDIEDWLYANPGEVDITYGQVDRWLARQYKVPSGIVDLLGIDEDGNLYVVEIKNGPINAAALAQVCRYKADIQYVLYEVEGRNGPLGRLTIFSVAIGTSIDGQAMFEAGALDVAVLTFSTHLQVVLSSLVGWKDEFEQKLFGDYKSMASDPVFSPIVEIAQRNLAIVNTDSEVPYAELTYAEESAVIELSTNGTGE